MQTVSVTLATVGAFSWSRLEPSPGHYNFAWLDDVLGRLHAGGVGVMLAKATPPPPPWFSRRYPESLPVTAEAVRLHQGSRQHFSPSSAAYRMHALQLCRADSRALRLPPSARCVAREQRDWVPRS